MNAHWERWFQENLRYANDAVRRAKQNLESYKRQANMNITQTSNYSFEIHFDYPDKESGEYISHTLSVNVVADSIAEAWKEMQDQWERKYVLSKVDRAKIELEIEAIPDEAA